MCGFAAAWTLLAPATAAVLPATAASLAALPAGFDLDHPAGLAFKGSTLLVAATGLGQLKSVALDGTMTTVLDHLVPGAFDRGVTGVAVDGSNNAYVAVTDEGTVYAVTPGGQSGAYARGLGAPYGLAFAPDGTLYVADAAADRLLAVSPSHAVRTVATLDAAPFGVALGPDGNIYVSLVRTGVIDRVTPAGVVSTYATLAAASGSVADAEGLAFDTTGALYVGAGAGDISNATPTSTGHVVVVPAGGSGSATELAANLAGPLNLAFAPTGPLLYVAAQAEGVGLTKNHVSAITVPAVGLALAHPTLALTLLAPLPPDASVYTPAAGSTNGGLAMDPATHAAELPVPFMADTGQNAGEPMIAVTHSGAVFMDDVSFVGSPCFNGNVGGFPHTLLRKSTDGGRTFVDATPPFLMQNTGTSSPPCSLDPYLYYDRSAGRLIDGDLSGICTYWQGSDDDGANWKMLTACGAGALDDHETLAAGPPAAGQTLTGYPNALYYCWQTVGYAGCNNSVNGGSTWSQAPSRPYVNGPTVDVCGAVVAGQNGEQTGHVVVGLDGEVYLPKANCLNGPMVAVSTDGGGTWTQYLVHGEAQAQDHEAGVAVDRAGTVYYDWVDGTTSMPMLSVSRDHGHNWSTPIAIAPPGVTEADQITLNAGGKGRLVAYFYGTTSDCCYTRTNATKAATDNPNPSGTDGNAPTGTLTSAWNAYAVIIEGADTASPTLISTPMNDAHVPLVRGNCGPGRCSNSFDFWGTDIDDGGRLWTSITNECIQTICSKPGLRGVGDGVAEGFAGQLLCGPRLDRAGALTPPSWATNAYCAKPAGVTPVAVTSPTPPPSPTAAAVSPSPTTAVRAIPNTSRSARELAALLATLLLVTGAIAAGLLRGRRLA